MIEMVGHASATEFCCRKPTLCDRPWAEGQACGFLRLHILCFRWPYGWIPIPIVGLRHGEGPRGGAGRGQSWRRRERH